MLTEHLFLAIRLVGPLQSWGFESQYNRRTTGLMPSKSGIAGICCAALGLHRGSEEETNFLVAFAKIRMTAIAIPRMDNHGEQAVRRMEDYHTIKNTRTADGKVKDCHITHRQYLLDSSFGVLLAGSADLIRSISLGLQNPIWGLYLGRKTCIPAAPIFAGLYGSENAALSALIGEQPLSEFTHQMDVENWEDGKDSLADLPVSFNSAQRVFAPRRVVTVEAKK